MRAWLEVHAGDLLGRPDLSARGEDLAARIVEGFDAHGTFEEWNSPTYYGVDMYALRLWRLHSPSLAAPGERLERGLWSGLAPWYHAGLGNIAGPYTRAYGMDMRRYVAAIGLWIAHAAPEATPPVPALSAPFSHSHDLSLAPVVAMLGTDPPVDAAPDLHRFSGERTVECNVSSDPERVATAWLGTDLMIGAERGARSWSARNQYHPATVHWRDPTGRTRWIRLVHTGPVDATAGPRTMRVVARTHRRRGAHPIAFLLSASDGVDGGRWDLPGLTVTIRSDARFLGAQRAGDVVEARYDPPASGAANFELSFET
jgi:hypothetical protein